VRLVEAPDPIRMPAVGRAQADRVAFPSPPVADVVEILENDPTTGALDNSPSEADRPVLPRVLSVLGGVVRAPGVGERGRNRKDDRNVESPGVALHGPASPTVIGSDSVSVQTHIDFDHVP